jgi:hypothetical protein
MYRLLESLCYADDAQARAEGEKLAASFAQAVQATPADKLESKKNEVLQFQKAMSYLAKFKLLPADFAPKQQMDALVKQQGWDKKK